MHLNLKDDETVALVSEVARRLGVTKTGAVRVMAQEKLLELEASAQSEFDARLQHAVDWLERDVWPQTAQLTGLNTDDEEKLLGYDELTR